MLKLQTIILGNGQQLLNFFHSGSDDFWAKRSTARIGTNQFQISYIPYSTESVCTKRTSKNACQTAFGTSSTFSPKTSPQSPKPTTKTRPVSFQPEDISAAFFISSRCCSASCRCRPKYAWRVARGGHGFPTQNPPFGMTTWWGYRLSVNHKRFMWGHHPERLGRFTHENPNNLELSCSNLPRYIHVGYSE